MHPVKQKLPNAWGLYDRAGNVYEWCHDWYQVSSDSRVVRGGSWSTPAFNLRAADRYFSFPPTNQNTDLGFRCCRTT